MKFKHILEKTIDKITMNDFKELIDYINDMEIEKKRVTVQVKGTAVLRDLTGFTHEIELAHYFSKDQGFPKTMHFPLEAKEEDSVFLPSDEVSSLHFYPHQKRTYQLEGISRWNNVPYYKEVSDGN